MASLAKSMEKEMRWDTLFANTFIMSF